MNQEIFCIRKDAADLHLILFDGTLIRHGERWSALPREVVQNPAGVPSIVFEVIRPGVLDKPSFFKIWLQAIRPESLSITIAPGITVLLLGLLHQWTVSWVVGALAILGVVCLHISVNVLNDVEDHLRLVDLPGSQGGSGVIQRGWVSARNLKAMGYISLVLGSLLGIPAVLGSSQALLWIGAMGAMGVLAYSNRPFGMKYRSLGDVLIFALVGPLLTIGYSLSIFGHINNSVLFFGIFYGLLAWAIFHTQNLQDIEVDRASGVSTIATQVGFKSSRHILGGLYILAYSVLGIGAAIQAFSAISLLPVFALGLPRVAILLHRVYKASGPASALLVSVRSEVVKLHFFHGLLIWIGLILSLVSI